MSSPWKLLTDTDSFSVDAEPYHISQRAPVTWSLPVEGGVDAAFDIMVHAPAAGEWVKRFAFYQYGIKHTKNIAPRLED